MTVIIVLYQPILDNLYKKLSYKLLRKRDFNYIYCVYIYSALYIKKSEGLLIGLRLSLKYNRRNRLHFYN
jgi:hypothetical protein